LSDIDSAFSQLILFEIFIQIVWRFYMQENKMGCFFSEHISSTPVSDWIHGFFDAWLHVFEIVLTLLIHLVGCLPLFRRPLPIQYSELLGMVIRCHQFVMLGQISLSLSFFKFLSVIVFIVFLYSWSCLFSGYSKYSSKPAHFGFKWSPLVLFSEAPAK